MSDIQDLDALVPESVIIKIGGKEITINPPKTADVFALGFLGQKLQEADKLSDPEIEQLITKLTNKVYDCVPELRDQALITSQLLAIVKIISDMAIPPDTKELAERGIEPADQKKVQ